MNPPYTKFTLDLWDDPVLPRWICGCCLLSSSIVRSDGTSCPFILGTDLARNFRSCRLASFLLSTHACCHGSKFQGRLWIFCSGRTSCTHLHIEGIFYQLFSKLVRRHFWRQHRARDCRFCFHYESISWILFYKNVDHLGKLVKCLAFPHADQLHFFFVCSTLKRAGRNAEAVLFMIKWKSHMAAFSSTSFVSNSDLMFFQNAMIKIG